MSAIKCVDCVHCAPRVTWYPSQFGIGVSTDYSDARCALTDVVTNSGRSGVLCTYERDAGACGPEALRFEAKPPEPPTPAPAPRRWWQFWRTA